MWIGSVVESRQQLGEDGKGRVRLPALATGCQLAAYGDIRLTAGQIDEARAKRLVRTAVVAQQANGPASHGREGMSQPFHGRRVVESPADIASPEVPQG